MKELVFASRNRHKAEEIAALLPSQYRLLTLDDIGFTGDIEETADTLDGNARIKARYVWEHYGLACFADDTGLEVRALHGEPGVRSARYAGEQRSDDANMRLLLRKLSSLEDRNACFRTCICLVEEGSEWMFEGRVVGLIAHSPIGINGFGYDPIFIPEGHELTFAQMELKQKSSMSHRSRALEKLLNHLNNNKDF